MTRRSLPRLIPVLAVLGLFAVAKGTSAAVPGTTATERWVGTWATAPQDGTVDFDAAVRDPDRPTRILPAYDAGDHLHLNDAGYTAKANAVPLFLFDAP